MKLKARMQQCVADNKGSKAAKRLRCVFKTLMVIERRYFLR